MVKRVILFSVAMTIAMTMAVPAANAALTVRVDRAAVNANESVSLVIEYSGSSDAEPSLDDLAANFEILGNQRSQMTTITNGRLSMRRSWQIELMPRHAGVVTVPAITLGSDRSEPIQIVVRDAAPRADTLGEDVVLEVSIDTDAPYVQAQVVYSVQLFVAVDTRNAALSDPEIRGVETIVQKLGEDQRSLTRRDGREYSVVNRKYALFPQASGELTIDPLMFEARLRSGRRFSGTRRVRSESLSLNVRPVPASFRENYPGAAWLPARSVRLDAIWPDPMPRLSAGEPVTRRIEIIAEGLTAAQLPELDIEQADGLKQYPDNAVTDDRIRTGTSFVVGVRRENVALIPTYGGQVELPGIELPWWNTQQDRVEIARLPPAILSVDGDRPDNELASVALSDAPGNTAIAASSKTNQQLWAWLALALGAGWLATLIVAARNHIRNAPAVPPEPNAAKATRPAALKRAAVEAARSGDAGGARDALIEWGQAAFPGSTVMSLGAIATYVGPELASAIDGLDRQLYAAVGGDWQGDDLASALANWKSGRHGKAQGRNPLPPLYPRQAET